MYIYFCFYLFLINPKSKIKCYFTIRRQDLLVLSKLLIKRKHSIVSKIELQDYYIIIVYNKLTLTTWKHKSI